MEKVLTWWRGLGSSQEAANRKRQEMEEMKGIPKVSGTNEIVA